MIRLIIIIITILMLLLFNFNKPALKVKVHVGGDVSLQRIKKTEADIDKITEILKNQNTILKQVLTPASTVKIQTQSQATLAKKDYRDWAPLGQAEQSSTYLHYEPHNALDANIKTYSQTNMPPLNKTSYYTLKLSRPVEISKIILHNVTFKPEIKKRLVPFKITILNQNDVEVAVKRFTDVLDEYTWDDIAVVGSTVKIVQEERNYLYISELNVFGIEANDCQYYQNKFKTDSSFQSLSLKESACKIINKTEQTEMHEQAKKFDKLTDKQAKLHKTKVKMSKKAWEIINRQQEIERETAATAERYGLPPPPAKFSEKQINLVKKHMSHPIKTLTTAQKAQCATLYDEAMKYKTASEKLAENSANENSNSKYYEALAKKNSKKYTEKWNEYQNKCSITSASTSTGSVDPTV